MFLRGKTEKQVLDLIRETLDRPDKCYTQGDGRRVRLKEYREPIGELVLLDEKCQLCTRLVKTVKVVYERDRVGDFYVVTAYPLFRKD